MEHSSRFFSNAACAYFPCHAGADPETFNCLFCYCPLYFLPKCPGTPRRTAKGVKDCTGCLFPHRPENYDQLIRCLSSAIRERAAQNTAGESSRNQEPASRQNPE